MQRVLELIRSEAPQPIPEGALTLSKPQASYQQGNTLVRVQGTQATGTYLDFAFRYNRVDLASRGTRVLTLQGEVTTHDLLARLNTVPVITYFLKAGSGKVAKQGLLLPADIVNEALELVTGENLIHLKATTDSYLFTGRLAVRITV